MSNVNATGRGFSCFGGGWWIWIMIAIIIFICIFPTIFDDC